MSVKLMNDVWEGAPYSGGVFSVLLALADNADDVSGYCYPGVDYLAWKTRQSVRNVQYCIKQLCDEGWIKASIATGDHGCNEYHINTERLRLAAIERRRKFDEYRAAKRGAKIAPDNPFNGCKDFTVGVQKNDQGVQPEAEGGATSCTRTIIKPSEEPSLNLVSPDGEDRKGKKVKRSDSRHVPFREVTMAAWRHKNGGDDPPWDGSDARALSNLLSAVPAMTLEKFEGLLKNWSSSEINHSERPRQFLPYITNYTGGPLNTYNKPKGGKNGNIAASKPIFDGFVNGGRAETPSRGQLPVRSVPALGPPAAR